jgi:DNA-binding Xre family transcriptional regulator
MEANEGNQMRKKGRVGSSFDDYLKSEGIYEDVTARAIKRVLARQLDALMREQSLTKTEFARRMKTSRSQLDRLLDPKHEAVTLETIQRAANVLGMRLRLDLVDADDEKEPA